MTGTATIRAIQTHLRAVVVWALVPVAALNGRTVSVCICGNGEVQSNCNAIVCAQPAATVSCGCPCCAKRRDGAGCCQGKSCCASKSHDPSSDTPREGWVAKTCCQLETQAHVTPTVVAKSSHDEFRASESPSVDAYVVQPLCEASIHRFDDAHPDIFTAPDIVIELRKLVI